MCRLRRPPSGRQGLRALDWASSGPVSVVARVGCVCGSGSPGLRSARKYVCRVGCGSAWLHVAAGLVGLWTPGIQGPCAIVARTRWVDRDVVPRLGLGACGRGRWMAWSQMELTTILAFVSVLHGSLLVCVCWTWRRFCCLCWSGSGLRVWGMWDLRNCVLGGANGLVFAVTSFPRSLNVGSSHASASCWLEPK